jgi:hypothetical protein
VTISVAVLSKAADILASICVHFSVPRSEMLPSCQ